MATNEEMDIVSGHMHREAKDLFLQMLDQRANQDADIQCSLVMGMIAAAGEILWQGRAPGTTPEVIAGKIHGAALDIIRQMQARQMPQ